MAAVLGASWTIRILLVALVILLGVGYLVWTHRAEPPEAQR